MPTSGWDSLDVVILLPTYLLMALKLTPGLAPSLLKFFALHPFLFRAVRLLKLLYSTQAAASMGGSTLKQIHSVVVAMVQSLWMFSSLFALLGVICFIFAVAAIQLFGAMCSEQVTHNRNKPCTIPYRLHSTPDTLHPNMCSEEVTLNHNPCTTAYSLYPNLCSEQDLLLPGRVALRCQLTDPSIILPSQFNFKTIPTSFMVLTPTINP